MAKKEVRVRRFIKSSSPEVIDESKLSSWQLPNPMQVSSLEHHYVSMSDAATGPSQKKRRKRKSCTFTPRDMAIKNALAACGMMETISDRPPVAPSLVTNETAEHNLKVHHFWAQKKTRSNKSLPNDVLDQLFQWAQLGKRDKSRKLTAEKAVEDLNSNMNRYVWDAQMNTTLARIKAYFSLTTAKMKEMMDQHTALSDEQEECAAQRLVDEEATI